MNARIFAGALWMFAVAAAMGLCFALFGPANLIRLLGAVALAGGVAGCALQIYALREFAPGRYRALRMRAGALARDASALHGATALTPLR